MRGVNVSTEEGARGSKRGIIMGKSERGTRERFEADDPDETPGRELYRQRADSLAKAQIRIALRRISLQEIS